MVYKFVDKKIDSGAIKSKIIKFEKCKVYSSFRVNISVAYFAHIQLISKFNKEIRFLLCVIDIFSKYARAVPLKDKKGITITNAFKNFQIN